MMMKKRIVAGALSALLTLSLCMGLGTTAFADGRQLSDGGQVSHGYAGKITKKLNMDENVTIPDATFTFKVERYSVDGSTETEKLAEIPEIANQTLTFSSEDESTTDPTTRVKTVTKETGSLLEGVTFPRVGVYVYKITEEADTYEAKNGEIMTYMSDPCYMTVYVENGELTPVIKTVDYRWVVPENQTKDDPTFDNNFTKIGSSDDPDPADDPRHEAGALEIAKTVTGAMGDKTKAFTFTLEITQLTAEMPLVQRVLTQIQSVDPEPRMTIERKYHGTIHRQGGTTEDITIPGKVGAQCTFTLKDGEYVTFSDMPVGTKYTVTETEANQDSYTTTAASLVNGKTSDTTANNLVGENANMVGYTNNKDASVPTGIIVNNLPFVMLILVSVCGFIGYIVFRRKRFYN